MGGSNNTHCKQVTNNAANILDNYTCNSSEPYWSVTCGMRSVCSGFRGFGEGRHRCENTDRELIFCTFIATRLGSVYSLNEEKQKIWRKVLTVL